MGADATIGRVGIAPESRGRKRRIERMRAHLPGGLRLGASVVTIGAFDGVHRGHQALICAAIAKADSLGTPSVAVTFDPPPKAHFAGAAILTAIDEKLRRLAMLGVDH